MYNEVQVEINNKFVWIIMYITVFKFLYITRHYINIFYREPYKVSNKLQIVNKVVGNFF